jgi:hypothetical protein
VTPEKEAGGPGRQVPSKHWGGPAL